jgi:hypothetical protein
MLTIKDIPGLTSSKISPDGKIAKIDVGAKLVIVPCALTKSNFARLWSVFLLAGRVI